MQSVAAKRQSTQLRMLTFYGRRLWSEHEGRISVIFWQVAAVEGEHHYLTAYCAVFPRVCTICRIRCSMRREKSRFDDTKRQEGTSLKKMALVLKSFRQSRLTSEAVHEQTGLYAGYALVISCINRHG